MYDEETLKLCDYLDLSIRARGVNFIIPNKLSENKDSVQWNTMCQTQLLPLFTMLVNEWNQTISIHDLSLQNNGPGYNYAPTIPSFGVLLM